MDRKQIFDIIREVLNETAAIFDIELEADISEKTLLYGVYLDSIALVSLVASIEDRLNKQGYLVIIANDRAFSRKASPFLNVRTLINFIEKLLKDGTTAAK